MATLVVSALQAVIYANAIGYLVRPQPYNDYYHAAAEQSENALNYLTEHEAAKAVTDAVRTIVARLPGRMQSERFVDRLLEGVEQPGPQGPERADQRVEGQQDAAAGAATQPGEIDAVAPPADSSTATIFQGPANFYPSKSISDLPQLSKSELDDVLESIRNRRARRQNDISKRIQHYRTGDVTPTETPKKRGKKSVRFALHTKPGSTSTTPIKDEDRLLSPLPPGPDSELNAFSTALAVPDGSVFMHADDFNEAAFIRRLPAAMKNGAGGIAWCKGRTEQGLYLLETPVRRLLLDLRAGVCYDGVTGRVMGEQQVLACVLWGRGRVEERFAGFGWRRGVGEAGR